MRPLRPSTRGRAALRLPAAPQAPLPLRGAAHLRPAAAPPRSCPRPPRRRRSPPPGNARRLRAR
eukprot:7295301-Prymnesium_polylepis.1